MNRILWSAAVVLVCAGRLTAQEVTDGTFTHKEHKVKLTVPDKEKFLIRTKDFEYQWPNSVCEFANEEAGLGGAVVVAKESKSAKEYAEWRLNSWKTQEGIEKFESLKSEKAAGRSGDWWMAEYRLKYGDATFHYLQLFRSDAKEGIVAEFVVWTVEEEWQNALATVQKLADGFQVGDGKSDPRTDPKTDPKNDGAKIDHPWLKYGEGSWVEHQISTKMTKPQPMESEMTTKRTLTKKGEKLTFKLESKMLKPTAMEMPATDLQEDSKVPGGSGGGMSGARELGKGEEDVEVAGKKVKCTWVETEYEMNGKKTTTKSWTSDEVPGMLVKSVTKNEDMESTMVALGFEKK